MKIIPFCICFVSHLICASLAKIKAVNLKFVSSAELTSIQGGATVGDLSLRPYIRHVNDLQLGYTRQGEFEIY